MEVDLGKRARVEALRAASRTLGLLLEENQAASELLAGEEPLPSRDGYLEIARKACSIGGIGALRVAKRLRVAEIAGRDLAGELPLEEVGRALSDLAEACLDATLEQVGGSQSLAVIGMGKLGGAELNYFSDIDVMFLADGDLGAATTAAEALVQQLGAFSPEGQAYLIDTKLRPEGRSGALVRSLDGFMEYYRRWAKPWEYQALIKARPLAGRRDLGERFVAETRPLVYQSEVSPDRVAEIRRVKERVESHVGRSGRRGKSRETDNVKLGPGGIRDIEFAVQLLQLVHGGSDESVRSGNTLVALSSLVDGGYVAEDDGAGLSVAYRWLRTVEHRLQLWQERRVHELPRETDARTRIARVMGFKDSPDAGALSRFDAAHASVLTDVRVRFEKLFYRPMVESLAGASATPLPEEALKDRLRVLGFRDVERAARTLHQLVSGSSRRSKLFRVLTPALLRFLAGSPLPDEGLFAFLRLGEALEARLDTLGALRDNPPAIQFLAKVLGSGRLLGEVLAQVPDELALVTDAKESPRPKQRPRLIREAEASLEWREPEARIDGLRRFKRREMLRVALADLAGTADVAEVGRGLAAIADACLEASLGDPPQPFAVIGMGKLGGEDLNYSSDIDVLFVSRGDPRVAETLASDLMKAIGEVTPEGQAFRIDAGLRPEGKSGPLARSLDSYLEYYSRWARPWEHLALVKARAVAGSLELADEFVARTRSFAFEPLDLEAALAEVRHLKARMEKERVPRGIEPRRHLKLGPGGLSDIDFSIALLQLQHGGEVGQVRVANALEAIRAAHESGLVSAEHAATLSAGYRFLSTLRNRLFFMAGRPVDALPNQPEQLEALGIAMGYVDQPRQELEEEFLRVTRRVRRVAEPLIYGAATRL